CDDERRLGTRELTEQPREMILPGPPLTALEVVLEVRVAAGDLGHPGERGRRERCTTQVRVDEDARGVEDAAKGRSSHACELPEGRLDERAGVRPLLDL